ncbi:MAG: CHAD domain-containing protein [Aggregatilineales bacterium]
MTTKTSRTKQSRKRTDGPGVRPEEPMSEAGRKVLAFHFKKLTEHETGVRAGKDRDAIHDMRVASRRLRSMLQLFAPFYRKRVIKPYAKILRQIAKQLGTVRDLDVLQIKAEHYLANHPDTAPDSLNGLLDHWQKQTKDARQTLIKVLDSSAYKRFATDFAEFVATSGEGIPPGSDEPAPILVRQVAPMVIYEHLAAVRAYEMVLDGPSLDTLHALRIEVKRLHYGLEAFAEVMSPEAQTALDATKTLQDYLGNLQDARVAGAVLQEYLDNAAENEPTGAILQYMAARANEKQDLLAGVPEAWAAFTDPDIRHALALGIAVL